MSDGNVVSLKRAPLKCPGVGRDADNDKSIAFYFTRKVTDAEMRYLHEVMQRAVALNPVEEPTP